MGLGGGDAGDDGPPGRGRPAVPVEESTGTSILKALADALTVPSSGGGKDFTIPALLSVHAFPARRDQVETDVTREFRAGEEGLQWILRVRDNDLHFLDVRDSGRFSNIDISLASALKHIVTGELGREVMNRSTAESDAGRILRGRMILRMIGTKRTPSTQRSTTSTTFGRSTSTATAPCPSSRTSGMPLSCD